MKKTLLAALMSTTLLFSACSMGASEDGSGSASGDASGKVKVGVILKTLSSEYWQYVAAGVKQAEKDLDVTVSLQGPASETAYDERRQIYLMSGKIIDSSSAPCVATGEAGVWTTTISAAVLLP